MFDALFLPVIEGLHGKKLPSLVGDLSGSSVSERTIRNWLGGKSRPRPAQIERLKKAGLTHYDAILPKRGWSEADAKKFLDGLSGTRGLLSSFVYSISAQNYYLYPQTQALAVQIDELSLRLGTLREADQLQQFVTVLLNSPLLELEHFVEPEAGAPSADELRQEVGNTTEWKALERPMAVVSINVVMQLLATLDLEFCSGYLEAFNATPIFQSLMPRLDPTAIPDENGKYAASRDLFHLPVRRLIELSACLRCIKRERKWPSDIPSVTDMAAWMNTDAVSITKWRMGRRFTLADYEGIWDAMYEYLPVKQRMAMPGPLAFASAVLTHLYVKGSRERGSLTLIIPDPEIYLRWWRIHRAQLESRKEGLPFGAIPWMPALS
ncbi:MAG: hypothetical protein V4639_06675 [Pseudomonadota bacterium]